MLDLIGDIPLVRLNRVSKDTGSEILVKPKFLNHSESIKHRIAKMMVEDTEKKGLLRPGCTIIEATTGNTGTALAFVAAVKGYKMRAYSPNLVANRSRMSIMFAYGCEMEAIDIAAYEVKRTGKSDGSGDSSVHGGPVELLPRQVCLELECENPDMWWARQFCNSMNVAAHRAWTAKEILEKCNGKLDAFVASVGTGGTILGVAQALKAHNPNILIVGVEPAGKAMMGNPDDYPIIPGISGGIIPQIFASKRVHRVESVSDSEAIDLAHQLARTEGIFCGMSSGANVVAALRTAKLIGQG